MKKFSFTGRRIGITLIFVLSIGMLLGDFFFSQGIFRPPQGKGGGITRPGGPSTSIVHIQPNFHIVTPGIWRSAQVNLEAVRRMRSYGLKTLVNLRLDQGVESWENERAKELGIQYFHFPFSGHELVPAKTVDAILSILSDPARQPALVHCAAGKDRTGMIVAAYRIAYTDWSFRDIYREMMMYGYEETFNPTMLKTLELWSTSRGRPEMAQEIALTRQGISEQKTQA